MTKEIDFAELTKNLTPAQKADLLSAMSDAKIKKTDTELVSLLIFLKLTREDYDKIQKDFDKSVQRAINVAESIALHSDTIKREVDQFDDIYAKKKANMSETLMEAKEELSKVVAENKRISRELLKDVNADKRVRYATILSACLIAIAASWIVFHFHYEARMTEERISAINTVVRQMEHNQDVLFELAKANRRLELQDGEKKGEKLLAISNAEGYTSLGKAGVIKFK